MTQDEIIEMARQAEFVNLDLCSSELERFAKLVAAKAIAELENQEPVAWSISPAVKGEDGRLYAYTNEKEWALSLVSKGHKIRPLVYGDTAPPQRTWVGMTDDEIDKAWRSVDYTVPWEQHRIDIAQAIEAKLKKKNT